MRAVDTAAALDRLIGIRAGSRLAGHDPTLWTGDAGAIAARLGWVDEPARMVAGTAAQIAEQAHDFAGGTECVLWSGMGGSSLFPELLTRSGLAGADAPTMAVLDTSHPAAVVRAVDAAV
jgi:hypothetical protein